MTPPSQLMCAGLPFEAEDTLRPAEREQLQLWRARVRRRAIVYGVIGVAPVVTFVVLHFVPHDALIMFSGLGFVLAPILWFGAVKYGLDARRYEKALKTDRVLRFVRVAPQVEPEFTDAAQQKLVRQVLKGDGPNDLRALSLLPESREVLAVNDVFASAGLKADTMSIATPPVSSWQLALPQALAVDAAVAGDATRRKLNRAEIEELMEKIRLLRKLSAGYWTLSALTLVIFLLWRSDGYPIPPKYATQILPPALWLFTMYEVARNRRNAARLGRDVALGWAVTLDDLKQPAVEGVKSCEILPFSSSLWTVDGAPAAWRGAKSFHSLLIDRR